MTSLSSFTDNLHDKVAITMCTFLQPGGREVTVPKIFLVKLRLFERKPALDAKGRYAITSGVDAFFARVMGNEAYAATADNVEQLRTLCDELGFSSFDGDSRRFGR